MGGGAATKDAATSGPDRNENRNDERCAQISIESIITWGEASGISDLPQDIATAIAADVTYRIRQTLSVCTQFLRHNKRRRLTPDDVNRALKWMDVPPVHGYTGSEAVTWHSIGDVGVHITQDNTVNLASTALSGDIFHQPGSPCVRGEWAFISGHSMIKREGSNNDIVPEPIPLHQDHQQYYHTLFNVIVGPSNDLFKIMCEDVSKSPGMSALVGPIVGGIMRGTHRAKHKSSILRRILLVIRALLHNPHLHFGHLYFGPQNYMRDIVNVVVFCTITERKTPKETHMIRGLACNVLLQVVCREPGCRGTWDMVVSSLGGVVASSSRPWVQHVGALMALLTLGTPAILNSLTPIARPYHNRLAHAITHTTQITTRDALHAHTSSCLLLAGLVNVIKNYIKSLPDHVVMFKSTPSQTTPSRPSIGDDITFEQIREIYKLGEEAYGSAFIVQIPSVYLCCTPENVPSFLQSSVYRDQAISGDALLNPPQSKRRKYQSAMKTKRSEVFSPSEVFEGYKLVKDTYIGVSVRGCPTKTMRDLKRKERMMPNVVGHPHRKLLSRYSSRVTGCMPHNTFTKPLYNKLKPPHTLQYLIL